MGLSPKLLGTDEVEVLHLRTHAKALVVPALLLLILACAFGIGLAALPVSVQDWAPWALLAVVVLLALWLCVVPFLRWWTTTYTLTNRRIITRRGILTKHGHDLPLVRVNDVSYQRSLLDRVLGCGTLVLQTAADDPVVLPDIPRVEQVHVQMTDLLFGADVAEAHEDH